jgi:hypothetical protein
MVGQDEERTATAAATSGGQDNAGGETGDTLEEHEQEAEQESAAAMDADVPQPPDASQTTEGQPS